MVDKLIKNTPSHPKGGRWSQEKRLEFIDFRLQWDGQLNRSDLIGFFGISVPQASLDIARYKELMPNNLHYDQGRKAYYPTEEFKPYFQTSTVNYYLNEVKSLQEEYISPDLSFVNWKPSVATIPMPKRTVPSEIFFAVLSSIRNKTSINVSYLSKNIKEPKATRCLCPHSIVYEGMRWHVRAYCHLREEFRDFVISRFLTIEETDKEFVPAKNDHEWNNILNLVFIPNPDLSPAHKHVVELEYGMKNGKTKMSCREALFFYVLRKFGISRDKKNTDIVQIILENHNDLLQYMPKSKSIEHE